MRETKDLEFKGSISNTFLKTVSAFANFNGGKILFGIADDGTEKASIILKNAVLRSKTR